MLEHNYTDPVAKLIFLGEAKLRTNHWFNYLSLGFSSEHIPELIRLSQDEELAKFAWEDDDIPPPQVFGQIHAWRALGQLRAVQAIPVLISFFHEIEDDDNDWVGENIPEALGLIGAPAIPACLAYLNDQSNDTFARVAAGTALEEIGSRHPEARDECVRALTSVLEAYLNNGPTVNGFIISNLANLKAAEAAPLVEKAYQEGVVEIEVCGDFEGFQVEVGLLKKRLTPSPFGSASALKKLLGGALTMDEARKRQSQKEKKEKEKARQAKKARKKKKR